MNEYGWEPHVLAVDPDYVEGVRDDLLNETVPDEVKVTYTRAYSIKATRRVGFGSLGFRCIRHIHRAARDIIKKEKIDLIYFSTTIFLTMALGHNLRNRFSIPYVLDFQDPWLSDYFRGSNASEAPGGKIRYGFSQTLARIFERRAMRNVAHIISVSPEYPRVLKNRYPWLKDEQFTVLPFGAPERDFEKLTTLNLKQGIFDRSDGKKHFVYVGRAVAAMAGALRILFLGLKAVREKNPAAWNSVKLHFVGTRYLASERATNTVESIARECGVADLVEETPQRVPYFEALQVMVDSDAILLLGSDDEGYTASKLLSCMLAGRPMLAIFHEKSLVVDIMNRFNAGGVIAFSSQGQPPDYVPRAAAALDEMLSSDRNKGPKRLADEFQTYTAREMARRQCAIFDNCLTSNPAQNRVESPALIVPDASR